MTAVTPATGSEQGWLNIAFDRSGRITAGQVAQQDPDIRQCYADASQSGESMITYASGNW